MVIDRILRLIASWFHLSPSHSILAVQIQILFLEVLTQSDILRYDTSHKICTLRYHNDVIKWQHFPRYWPFVRGIHPSPELSCYFYLRVNKRLSKQSWYWCLRHHRAHYDVIVMLCFVSLCATVIIYILIIRSGSNYCNTCPYWWKTNYCMIYNFNQYLPSCLLMRSLLLRWVLCIEMATWLCVLTSKY